MVTKARGTKPAIDPRESAEPSTPSAPRDPIKDASFGRRKTTAEKQKEKKVEMVSVTVPRPFKFTQDDHSIIDYPVGIYDMPRAHAEDTFSQGSGVTIND